jgi:hypothetical protein
MTNITSECRSANIVRDHATILPDDATPKPDGIFGNDRHIISPSAGRMRPKTSESGIFNTNRNKPVSTSILTRILVPNPKNAFQSPAVHKAGRFISDAVAVIICSYLDQELDFKSPDARSRPGRP